MYGASRVQGWLWLLLSGTLEEASMCHNYETFLTLSTLGAWREVGTHGESSLLGSQSTEGHKTVVNYTKAGSGRSLLAALAKCRA